MKDWTQPKHDGMNPVNYDFGVGEEANARISYCLNEAIHVFYCHAEGVWQSHDKDAYARLLIKEFQRFPQLPPRMLKSGDRIIKMLVYRALELMKEVVAE